MMRVIFRGRRNLVMLDNGSCCSAHCTGRFMRDKDQSPVYFCVAGAIVGEVRG